MKTKLKCASFFAGVGGIDLGFQKAGFETIYANEFDSFAVKTFESNFDIKVDHRDIKLVESESIPNFDILLAGFPCQPFSIAGYRQGFEDEKDRGNLFFELIRVIKIKKPRILFLENVKNLISHDKGNTFNVIKESLKQNGYHIKYKVLNAKDYGNIPHGRERIYIVGFLNENEFENFEFPNSIELKNKLPDYIDFEVSKDQKYYYSSSKNKFYATLENGMKNNDSIYQWRRMYVRENKSGVCPTLTANMGTGGHNVPLILTKNSNQKEIRKLTPRECFNLQGFPKDYILPKIAESQLYKQSGNSVVVPVIERIAEKIFSSLK
jgi:DNA (cytosine-5)-methyltransferase 1